MCIELANLVEELSQQQSEYATSLFLQAALDGHAGSMLQAGKRLFSGVHMSPNRIRGMAWVIAAARMNTKGAVAELMALVDTQANSVEVEAAWQLSEQLVSKNLKITDPLVKN